MAVELNHLIIPAKDKWASAKFLADILGLEAGPEWSHFVPVRTNNGVTLDYADAVEFRRQHYAFLVSESEFDTALSRIKSAGIGFYADFNRDGNAGMGLLQACQGSRQDAISQRRHRHNAKARNSLLPDLPSDVLKLVQAAEQALGFLKKRGALFGQNKPLLDAIEDSKAQLLFQPGNGATYGGLRQVDAVGCTGCSAALDDGTQHVEMSEVHNEAHLFGLCINSGEL